MEYITGRLTVLLLKGLSGLLCSREIHTPSLILLVNQLACLFVFSSAIESNMFYTSKPGHVCANF